MLVRKQYSLENGEDCPACQKSVRQVEYLYRRDDFKAKLFKCDECSLLFARPVFIEELTERQMDGVDDSEMFGSPTLKSIYTSWFLKKELREVRRKLKVDNPTLLDIGCGTGWTTAFWRDNGFIAHGLEPSITRSTHARDRYSLTVFNDYVENYEAENLYDVILLRHSLEHFESPVDVLGKIHKLLADDGLILLVVPNIDCLGRVMFGTDWSWVLPWHCNFFNPESIRNVLYYTGFSDINLYQTPSPLYFFESLDRKLNIRLFTALKRKFRVPLLLASAPFALLGLMLGMGDNITVVARKKHSLETVSCN
ncbi:MAG: class I SAM-dependent methyltransferase [Desulfuromonadales bacterium]|nr:class I SAM-dependent methyltransferase [Desulfuromonadales bacterium]